MVPVALLIASAFLSPGAKTKAAPERRADANSFGTAALLFRPINGTGWPSSGLHLTIQTSCQSCALHDSLVFQLLMGIN
jgi:hypothetical protein